MEDLQETSSLGTFGILFARNVPHILENIFLSLDNKCFQSCLEVNKTWRELLLTAPYQRKLEEMLAEKKKNSTKLHNAISKSRTVEEIERLIDNLVVDVNFALGLDETTPLIKASKAGDKRVVEILLDRGADIEKVDYWKKTALHWAAYYGKLDVVNLLIDEGAEVDKTDFNRFLILGCTRGIQRCGQNLI